MFVVFGFVVLLKFISMSGNPLSLSWRDAELQLLYSFTFELTKTLSGFWAVELGKCTICWFLRAETPVTFLFIICIVAATVLLVFVMNLILS